LPFTGDLFSGFNRLANTRTKTAAITYHTQAHTFFAQLFGLLLEVQMEQGHERLNLFGRTLPVFTAKGKNRENFYLQLLACRHDIADALDTHFMAGYTRHAALFGPTIVAIH